jgi:hypothetical protein
MAFLAAAAYVATYSLISSVVSARGTSDFSGRGMDEALTSGLLFSLARTAVSAVRPSAQSCRKMKEPFSWTASVTYSKDLGQLSSSDITEQDATHLFPCLYLGIGVYPRDIIITTSLLGYERGL